MIIYLKNGFILFEKDLPWWDSNSGPLDHEPTALRGRLLLNLI
jgi:hypothetical protein